MKNLFKYGGFAAIIVLLVCSLLGVVDASAAGEVSMAAVAVGAGGVVETGAEVTTQFTRESSEDLLLNDIERRVVKIRPMGNPLEQFSRYATRRNSKSQIHQYYSTDTLPASSTLKTAYTGAGNEQDTLDTNNNGIFSKYETIILPEYKGVAMDGGEEFLVLYIIDKATDGKLIVKAINASNTEDTNTIPSIAAGALMVRAGRGHNELDMQTTTYAVVPTKKTQYLQIFRAQIEESTLQKISDKEADWTFSDLEEEAIFDMKRGMNKSFWIGARKVVMDADSKEVFFTGGIWFQTGKEFPYGTSAADLQMTEEMLIELTKTAFTGTAGTGTKIFLMGSDLMANVSKIKRDRTVNDSRTLTKYGITFEEIKTNFGRLWCVHDESLDEFGFSKNGLIFDADYLRKVSVYELQAKDLDLRKAGQKDVDARTISEISALVLQNPNAHVRVVPKMA